MSYQHREAYCLMMYKCDKCHAIERFWNSRDGVTPFIVLGRCVCCKGDMTHTDFHMDVVAPDHTPYQGQGVFTDMPDALKRTYAHLRAIKYREMGETMDELMEEAIYKSFQAGEPFFFRWRA